mgnify:CR=1 FL=1
MKNQTKFLKELEELCIKYSSRNEWEWKEGSRGEDGIYFKFLYVDVNEVSP